MSKYQRLGVDVKKSGIEQFKEYVENLYPNAFCVVQRDPENPAIGLIMHTDSAGSKPIQAYIQYKETDDVDWFRGLPQDALAMNLNDILCVGAEPVTFVDYVAFNTLDIERVNLLRALSEGFGECIDTMKAENVPIMFAGGETADLPDLIRTLDVSVTIFGRSPLADLITGDQITDGDAIIGLGSAGRVRYEQGINSGIMSNGHTLARTCLMSPEYLTKYPEISHSSRGRYIGHYRFDDYIDDLEMTVGEALLSPTRLYAPVVKSILDKHRADVHGMVHNTGGGQTKCLRLGEGIKYIKDQLPPTEPIFNLIQREGSVDWKEMYQDFNMGIGYELIIAPSAEEDVISIADQYGLLVAKIGYCKKNKKGNELEIISPHGRFLYTN